jgi:hypothetical protein
MVCASSIAVTLLRWDGFTFNLVYQTETASDCRPVNTDSALLVEDRGQLKRAVPVAALE